MKRNYLLVILAAALVLLQGCSNRPKSYGESIDLSLALYNSQQYQKSIEAAQRRCNWNRIPRSPTTTSAGRITSCSSGTKRFWRAGRRWPSIPNSAWQRTTWPGLKPRAPARPVARSNQVLRGIPQRQLDSLQRGGVSEGG